MRHLPVKRPVFPIVQLYYAKDQCEITPVICKKKHFYLNVLKKKNHSKIGQYVQVIFINISLYTKLQTMFIH